MGTQGAISETAQGRFLNQKEAALCDLQLLFHEWII